MINRPKVRATPTGYSSARYGACECCGTHAPDVWIGTADDGYTHTFGHEACVKRAIGMVTETKCDTCGDESNSAPGLQCGRIEYDEDSGEPTTDPCVGIYR